MQKAIENNVFMCLVKSIDYICLHNQLHPLGNRKEEWQRSPPCHMHDYVLQKFPSE